MCVNDLHPGESSNDAGLNDGQWKYIEDLIKHLENRLVTMNQVSFRTVIRTDGVRMDGVFGFDLTLERFSVKKWCWFVGVWFPGTRDVVRESRPPVGSPQLQKINIWSTTEQIRVG